MNTENAILLSFDVEEFDLPLEYGQPLKIEAQLKTGYKGLEILEPMLNKAGITTTLFTTAFFAQHFPITIKDLAAHHEIASHTFYHTRFMPEDLLSSRLALEAITDRPVTGLRMPRMKAVSAECVSGAGYSYNSSINPTWIPGRYDNRHLSRHPFLEGGLLQFPVSVTPWLRIPLFWIAFKNLPYSLFYKLALQTLKQDGYLALYFHPWEFTDLRDFSIPAYLKRGSHKTLLRKLQRFVSDLSHEGTFMTIQEFITARAKKQPC